MLDAEAVLRERRESMHTALEGERSLRERRSLVEPGEGNVVASDNDVDGVEVGAAAIAGNRNAVYGGLPDMPASTISLLQELAVDSASMRGAGAGTEVEDENEPDAMQVDEVGRAQQGMNAGRVGLTAWANTAPTSAGPPVLALPATTPSADSPFMNTIPLNSTTQMPVALPSTSPSLRAIPGSNSRPASMASERRHSRIGNIAGRVGGWLGLRRDDAQERETDQAGPAGMDVESGTGVADGVSSPQLPSAGPPVASSNAQANDPAPATASATAGPADENAPAPPTRHHGPLMLVQGFVQTSIARRPGPAEATTSTLPAAPTSNARTAASTPSAAPLTSTISEPARPGLRTRTSFTVSENATDSRLGDVSPAVAEEPAPNPRAGISRRYSDGEVHFGREQAANSENTGTPASSESGGPRGRRGLFGRYRRANAPPPAFQEQARMLAGLLSVATAATASTLLSPGPANPIATAASATAAAGTGNAGGGTTSTASGTGQNAGENSVTPASPRPHTGPRAVLETLRNRFRPNSAARQGAEDNSIEAVLRDYMRHTMNPQRDLQAEVERDTTGEVVISEGTLRRQTGLTPQQPSLSTILPNTDPSSFEAFLNSMQLDLIRSLREFNGDLSAAELEEGHPSRGNQASLASGGSTEPMDVDPPAVVSDDTAQSTSVGSDTPEQTTSAAAGATPLTDTEDTSAAPATSIAEEEESHPLGVEGVEESSDQPPRLNFFRVFQFPARDVLDRAPSTSNTAAARPSISLIPAVIIGVRSISRDISTIGRDDAGSAAFPFDSAEEDQSANTQASTQHAATQHGTGASAGPGPTSSPSSSSGRPGLASADGQRGRRSRSSFLGALRSMGINRRSRSQDRAEERSEVLAEMVPAVDTRNYVIWVIGGHYPAGHPILTVPRLFTGELTHDDLWALAEALGSVKPPVATKEDIAKAGLQVIKGAEIKPAVEAGKVHDMCLERCLVSSHPDSDASSGVNGFTS